MIDCMVIIFVVSALGVFYAYFGYPMVLFAMSLLHKHPIVKKNIQPSVTLILTAYNEEARIRQKLENTVLIDYPRNLFQIIVASDGSTDKTNEIIREYADKGFEFLDVQGRKGKENAQKEAIKKASGDIIVFSDIATRLKPDAIRQITANFADPSIGCVSSMDKVISDDGDEYGEGAYVRYEMWVRLLESRVNTVVGLSGSFFAARKEVCQDFSDSMDSDFRTLLNSRKAGMRGIVDPAAIGCYKSVNDPSREFSRKIRTVVRGLTVFFNSLEFCNVFRYGMFSWQYLSHKLFKWLVPFFLVAAFLSNVVGAFDYGLLKWVLVMQIIFYGIAAIPLVNRSANYPSIITIPHFFVSVNVAIAIAWFKFIRGDRIIVWQPSERK